MNPNQNAAAFGAIVDRFFQLTRPVWALVEGIVMPFWLVIKGAIGIALWLLEMPLNFALKATPLGMLLRKFSHDQDILGWLERTSQKLTPATGYGLLVHGRRREFAEVVAPKAKYPLLYMTIPEHLKRSIVIDGKTMNDMAPATALAGTTLTGDFVQKAYRAGVTAGTRAAYLSLLAGIVFAGYVAFKPNVSVSSLSSAGGFFSHSSSSSAMDKRSLLAQAQANGVKSLSAEQIRALVPQLSSMERQVVIAQLSDDDKAYIQQAMRGGAEAPATGRTPVAGNAFTVASNYVDVWTPADAEAVNSKLREAVAAKGDPSAVAAKVQGFVSGTVQFIILVVAAIGVAIAAGLYVWLARFRYIVYDAVDVAVSPLRKPWREGQQRNRDRQEERELWLEAYLDQVLTATQVDKSPRIYLGEALGVAEFRGSLAAPKQFSEVYMTIVDLLQHVEVLGGSGEGKSRDVFVNVLRQLLQLRKQGYPVSLYITDDKGEMAALTRRLAKEIGLPDDDILVIGTDPTDWRVDLLDGVPPVVMSEILTIVAAQAGSGGGDDFWPDMANDITLQTAILLEAAERTRAGEEWTRVNGIRMYSFVNTLRTAAIDSELEMVIKIVLDALQSTDEYPRVADLDKTALYSAAEYIIQNWLSMVDATKDGIKANARKALRGMALREELARGYGDGAGANLIPITALASNKVKVINISQTELGKAGRTVLIFLRTMRFKMARDHQKQNPGFSDERLQWWMNGASTTQPDRDKYVIEIFKADEYQLQATAASSSESGLADSGVWNVLRSAAIGGMIYSQGQGAYVLAIGEKAATNMRAQFRSKFIMRTEDKETIREAKELAGKVTRYHNIFQEHYESMTAVRRQLGVDPDAMPKVRWSNRYDKLSLWGNPAQTGEFVFEEWDKPFDVDQRFIMNPALAESASQTLSSEQAATWRAEDKSKEAMSQGMYDADVVQAQDIKNMGRARAFGSWQCCGGSMNDYVWMNGSANKARRQKLIEQATKADDATLIREDALV